MGHRRDDQFVGAAETLQCRQPLGDPDEVAERLSALQRLSGADELVVTSVTHDHQARLRSHELLAKRWGIDR